MAGRARPTKHRLECFCSRRPLLAFYGVDELNQVYIHIRAFKQQRIYCDTIIYGGRVKIHCRECFRWHWINVVGRQASLRESDPPNEVDQPGPPRESSAPKIRMVQ